MLTFYVVVTADGTLKLGARAYLYYKHAENAAKNDGDSVVRVDVPHDKAPLFIRRKVV